MSWLKDLKEKPMIYKRGIPAIRSYWDVLLYPCYHALKAYRKAHKLWTQGHFFRARLISQRAARKTGIEIHPGAVIGKDFSLTTARELSSERQPLSGIMSLFIRVSPWAEREKKEAPYP